MRYQGAKHIELSKGATMKELSFCRNRKAGDEPIPIALEGLSKISPNDTEYLSSSATSAKVSSVWNRPKTMQSFDPSIQIPTKRDEQSYLPATLQTIAVPILLPFDEKNLPFEFGKDSDNPSEKHFLEAEHETYTHDRHHGHSEGENITFFNHETGRWNEGHPHEYKFLPRTLRDAFAKVVLHNLNNDPGLTVTHNGITHTLSDLNVSLVATWGS